jgi:replicative DNA helicase
MLSDLRESGCIAATNDEFSLQNQNNNRAVSPKVFKIKSWNQDVLVNKQLTKFDFKGVKPTFLLKFKYNKAICLTSNHRILSKDGWIRTSQIQKDTEIYCLLQTTNKNRFKYNYCKIENVTYQGIKEVYDKTIVGFHNYLSKDIVLHNSIEQDADIVIMLYREEYYKENTSEEQITEIIVAKHRNGPIGTAKLLFKSSVTSFVNL